MPLLAGGLSRVVVSVAGWGRLLVAFQETGGRHSSSWTFFAGKTVKYLVDLRPPGVLSISAVNIFGADKCEWSLRADQEIPAPLGELQAHEFSPTFGLPKVAVALAPRVALFNPVHPKLPQLKIPETFLEQEK
jgi:hypothetical protein